MATTKSYDPYGDISVGNLISYILKEILKGKDIHRIPLPSLILEHRSTLERFADLLSFVDFFVESATKDPAERSFSIVQTYISGWIESFGILRKPINPLLGEIYIGSQTHGDHKSEVVLEQVSHHPPISAFYWECRSLGLVIKGQALTKSSMSGQTFYIKFPGFITYKYLDDGSTYTFDFPDVSIRNLMMGKKFTELIGKINITEKILGSLEFKAKPYWGGDKNEVFGIIKNVETKVEELIVGKFTESVYCIPVRILEIILERDVTEKNFKKKYGSIAKFLKCIKEDDIDNLKEYNLFETTELKSNKVRTVDNEEMIEWESKEVWKELSMLIQNCDLKNSDKHKEKVEELQRTREKDLEERNETYIPILFSRDENGNYNFIQELTEDVFKDDKSRKDDQSTLRKKVLEIYTNKVKYNPTSEKMKFK